jgi:ABC-type branched-subunit amino acid transport system ATPase component
MGQLSIKNVSKKFSQILVLNSVTLRLTQGNMTALIGNNGCGKSTLLSVLSGQLKHDDGHIYLDGICIDSTTIHERSKLGIARMSQESRLWESMSVAEHLLLVNSLYKLKQINITNLMKVANINKLTFSYLPNQLSLFERRRLELFMALIGSRFLLCDELGAGLSIIEARELYDIVLKMVKCGWTESSLMIEHRQELLDEYCSEFFYLQNGVIKSNILPFNVIG